MICFASSIFDNIIKNKKQTGIIQTLFSINFLLFLYQLLMNRQNKTETAFLNRDKVIQMKHIAADDTFSDLSKSEYSMNEVLGLEQFRQLSKEIRIQDKQGDRLIDSFYCPQWKPRNSKFERKNEGPSIYSQQYSRWKGEQPQQGSFKSTYTSSLALLNKQQQKQEVDRLIKEYSIDRAIFSYSQQNPLSQINQQYIKSLANVTKDKRLQIPSKFQSQNQKEGFAVMNNHSFKPDPVRKWQELERNEKDKRKQEIIQLQVQKHLLQRMKKINQQQKREQQKARKQKQLKKTCFKDLITRPPNIQKKEKVSTPQETFKQTQKRIYFNDEVDYDSKINESLNHQQMKKFTKKQAHYKLNLDEILKIPHRLFLIFYSENHHQIVRLSTPSDLKRINHYRAQALRRQQAVQILKKKVSQQGSELVSKLPSQMKQKLFKVLYEQDLQQQKYTQQHSI